LNEGAGRENFLGATGVSRETLARFDRYAELLMKWNPAINLVAPSTLKELWTRHFLDSAAVYQAGKEKAGRWLDFGSGAGFPGMVAALLSNVDRARLEFTLVESDQRKATFLRTVSRETSTPVTVIASRIEALAPQSADVVSARAVAPLTRLLDLARPHLAPGGICLFPKGAGHLHEVEEALAHWRFQMDLLPSATDPESAILKIGEIERA
jgi:16S rRNA (guanine527-N7)-methyltransferase